MEYRDVAFLVCTRIHGQEPLRPEELSRTNETTLDIPVCPSNTPPALVGRRETTDLIHDKSFLWNGLIRQSLGIAFE